MNLFNTSKYLPDWLISRRRYFFLVGLDLLIITSTYLIQHESLNLNNLTIHIFTIIWILTSYTFGRYELKKKSFIEILLRQIKNSIIFFTCFSFYIYLLRDVQNYQLFYLFTQIIILSLIGQILLNRIIICYSKESKYWLFVGKETTFLKIKKALEETRVEGIIKLYDKKTNLKVNNNFDSIIFENPFLIKNKLANQDYKNIKKISIYEWVLSILNRIPNTIISSKFLKKIIKEKLNQKVHFGIKRLADIIFSILLIFITLPLVVISVILIKFEDRGPIFYSQIRSGVNGKEFRIWKLRTMYINSENVSPKWAVKNDKRITKIGKLLRRTRIDELPQLVAIILGKMSLIGPRPERPEFDTILENEIPNYQLRYKIKPGLSGWAQVNFNYGSSIEDAAKKLSYDLYYISQFSIWLDFLIFIKTIKLVFNGKGSEPKKMKMN